MSKKSSKENPIEKNSENLDNILLKIESLIFSIDNEIEVDRKEIIEILDIIKELICFNDDYKLMCEEIKILWLKVDELEGQLCKKNKTSKTS